jgi:hypothetical protein
MLRHLVPLDVLLLALSQVLEELEGALLTNGQQGVNWQKVNLEGLTDYVEEGVEVFVVLVTEEDLLDVSLIHGSLCYYN